MPYLGLDTATSRGSVALARPGEVLGEASLPDRVAHARDLLTSVDRILRSAGLESRDLLGIGVAVGPGSFIGVRVGMATAKGLGYALRIGVAGISTLEAIARAAARAGRDAVCAAIGAGRGEVYGALFRVDSGVPVRTAPDRSYRPASLAGTLPEGCLLVGDGATMILGEVAPDGGGRFAVLDPCPLLAGTIALWASSTIAPGTPYRAGTLGPNYVRPSDAETARRRP